MGGEVSTGPTAEEILAYREACGGFPERERVRCAHCGKITAEPVPKDWEEPESEWIMFYCPGKCIEAFKLEMAALAFCPTMHLG